ncbi:MAG: hypothetical protein AAF968_23405 [Pseudomonadota bacterium]
MAVFPRLQFGHRVRDWAALGLGMGILVVGVVAILLTSGEDTSQDLQLTVGGEPKRVLDLVPATE